MIADGFQFYNLLMFSFSFSATETSFISAKYFYFFCEELESFCVRNYFFFVVTKAFCSPCLRVKAFDQESSTLTYYDHYINLGSHVKYYRHLIIATKKAPLINPKSRLCYH